MRQFEAEIGLALEEVVPPGARRGPAWDLIKSSQPEVRASTITGYVFDAGREPVSKAEWGGSGMLVWM